MSLNQGKYKPSIAAIDEVDDHNLKSSDLQKQPIEGSETAPLTINQHKLNLDDNITGKDIESQNDGRKQSGGTSTSNGNGSIHGLRAFLLPGRIPIDALMRLSRKRRILYITTACLCAVLLIIIMFMIAFWPNVPFYLTVPLCLEKECVEAGRQILLWANTTKSPCRETYEWACGKFHNEYADNDYYVIKRGEWNFKTYNEFQELNELNRFISMLPTSSVSNSVESMVSGLYRSCREIDTLDKSLSESILKRAINVVGSLRESSLTDYKYQKALILLQVNYGIFPYFKVSVANHPQHPHGYMIAIDEGEVGLPDKYFYNIYPNDEIERNYKLQMRDFAINMGSTLNEATRFADEVFNYEKRIVNDIGDFIESSNERQHYEITTLAELKSIAQSLPIIETISALFTHTKITEDTEVLVRDAKILSELSKIVSSTDKRVINNFIIWSLVRHLLPHLSKEYRTLVENFDHSIYGRTASYPRWMVCSKVVKDWLPFAIDALQERQESSIINSHLKQKTFPNKTIANDEVLSYIFHTVRNELQSTLQQASWINESVKQYFNKKLTEIRFQIGIPKEALYNKSYVKDYYDRLLLSNIFFAEHLESIWSFRKSRMEHKLKSLNAVDSIVSELYTRDEPQPIVYSNILNMLIVTRSAIISKYYDYKYPIPINFARIGADMLEVLIESLPTFVIQYNAERQANNVNETEFILPKVDVNCLVADELDKNDLKDLTADALKSFGITLSASKIAARALSTFIQTIDEGNPIMGSSITPDLNYENLHLTKRHRVPGLRSFNENELFTLAYMQKHCSTPIGENDYTRIKPLVEQRLAERYLFNTTWKHIQFLQRSISCSASETSCSNIL